MGWWPEEGRLILGAQGWRDTAPATGEKHGQSCGSGDAEGERAKQPELDTRLHRDKEFLSMSQELCFKKINLTGNKFKANFLFFWKSSKIIYFCLSAKVQVLNMKDL